MYICLPARMAPGSQGAERASPLRQMREGAGISPVTPGGAGGPPYPPGAGGSVRGRGGSRSRAAVAVFEGWVEAQEVGVEDSRLPGRCIVAAERGRRPAGTGMGSSHRRRPHPLAPRRLEQPRRAGGWCTLASAMFGWVW